MIKLFELNSENATTLLRELPRDEVRLLWHYGYWDGPLSGILLYREQRYWFEMFAETDRYRHYYVIELLPEQLREVEYWHKLFREKVGTHTDYDENNRRSIEGNLKPEDTWNEFYNPYQKRTLPDYSNNIVIGWTRF